MKKYFTLYFVGWNVGNAQHSTPFSELEQAIDHAIDLKEVNDVWDPDCSSTQYYDYPNIYEVDVEVNFNNLRKIDDELFSR